jgi:hypothetical protein
MCSDHPEFRARLQTISVKTPVLAIFGLSESGLNLKSGGQSSPLQPVSAVDEII